MAKMNHYFMIHDRNLLNLKLELKFYYCEIGEGNGVTFSIARKKLRQWHNLLEKSFEIFT